MKSKYSDSTLQHMTKAELIEYIRCLEHNLKNAEEMNENQYGLLRELVNKDDILKLLKNKQQPKECIMKYVGRADEPYSLYKCSACGAHVQDEDEYKYCPWCGAKIKEWE